MIVVDTSAWVEFLRDTGSEVCNTVDALLDADIAICDAISMEVLAGARNERHLGELRRLLARAVDPDHFGGLRRSRGVPALSGAAARTVRKMIDCLIGAVTIRARVPILHSDADFAALTRHTSLVAHPTSGS
ncbi:MAG: PIN domain-containing protein [Ilumatobacteraceae bacterium]